MSEKVNAGRFCKRCLLSETDEKQIYESVQAYVSSLSPEEKADDSTYARRLTVCRLCDHLLSGLCVKCGCFVEARAASARQKCPSVPAKW